VKNVCLNNLALTQAIKESDIVIHPELLSSMSYCLMKSGQLVRAKMDQILEKFELISPQLGVLIVIRSSPSINQLQLGEQLGIDKATMVKLIDSLEKKNLVERLTDPKDRRAKLINITKEGIKFCERMIKERSKIEEEFLKPFPKKDQELIKRLIPQLLISFHSVSKSSKK